MKIGVGIYLGAMRAASSVPVGATYFPMSNTAVDPTYSTWRINNPGYTFVPNDGIYTATPMTNASDMLLGWTGNDPDVALWDTSSFTVMARMFLLASAFNQDLSGWCVSLHPTKPTLFDDSATAWVLPRPVWGTCPP